MAITRSYLNSLAQIAMDTMGPDMTETVTFKYQATAGGAITTISDLQVKLSSYSKRAVDQNPVLADAKRCRIPWETLIVSGSQVEPTRYCTLTRNDGSVWKVDEIEDGDQRPNWFLQMSRVA